VALLDRLRPRPEVLRLLSAAVLDRWNEEQKEVATRRAAVEQRLETLRQRKERVVNAYLYEGAIDKETYQSHLARVEEELTLARIDHYDTEIEELDIEGTLAFAEHLINESSRLWIEAGLAQRQRLQKLFFPKGLSYDGEEFRTPLTCPFFNNLEGTPEPGWRMVNLPGIERPMVVDAVACVASGLLGTSTSGAFIESATGIREGARTGLAAVVTGGLFALSLFFLPLVAPLQQMRYAYSPALVIVGLLMVTTIRRVELDDLTEAVPAFLTITLMVFTYNIANGLTAGLVAWPAVKLLAGRWREIGPGALVLGLACLAYYLFGLPH